ncbi:MAG: hypothetical protein IPK32_19350 [Verrucomicrobiaceae bacterium]|nr:hypothetical protein [Verrucomicrobiaceae bacterium]
MSAESPVTTASPHLTHVMEHAPGQLLETVAEREQKEGVLQTLIEVRSAPRAAQARDRPDGLAQAPGGHFCAF